MVFDTNPMTVLCDARKKNVAHPANEAARGLSHRAGDCLQFRGVDALAPEIDHGELGCRLAAAVMWMGSPAPLRASNSRGCAFASARLTCLTTIS
jgi:hypothetical protein